MATSARIGRNSYIPFSQSQMRRSNVGMPNSDLAQLLQWNAKDFALSYFEDFALPASATLPTYWTSAVTAGGAPTAFAVPATALLGGAISGLTGTTDNGVAAIAGPLIYRGDNNPLFVCRFKINTVSGYSFEIGWSDALTDEALPAVTDIDTPAIGNGSADTAVVHLDTHQTLTTMGFITGSTTSTYAATKTDLGTRAPTAATYMTVMVGIETNSAFCKVFDANYALLEQASHGGNYIEGGTLIRPHILNRTRNTSSKTMDIDYVAVLMDRR